MQTLSRFVIALFLLIVTSFIKDASSEKEDLQAYKSQSEIQKASTEKVTAIHHFSRCS
ncbi:hypothetical protein [Muriicola sp. E247]|uniref:hypothetical protein n=1 Tax=Muriicola sp. E247 TaxID=3242730 RepID=UPI00352601A9